MSKLVRRNQSLTLNRDESKKNIRDDLEANISKSKKSAVKQVLYDIWDCLSLQQPPLVFCGSRIHKTKHRGHVSDKIKP